MNAAPSITDRVSELERDLKSLDEQYASYRETRERYVQAIGALKGVNGSVRGGSSRITETRIDSVRTSMVALLPISKKEAVDLAIKALPEKFSTVDLKAYINRHYPEAAKEIKGSYLPTRLAALKAQGRITLLEQENGKDGRANSWSKNT
jgi:hypothetical protein